MTIGTSGVRAVMLATVVTLTAAAGASAWAQNPPEFAVQVPANALSVGEIESRLTAQGIKVKEIKVRDLLAEVEGYDAQGREIELMIDRRNGETLSHEYDDDDRKKRK
ncbi:PepSY domain-containing protein [Peristeroidobacter agariperforans]|uniref:PepSY domain-containing protein n=1 Tax=Peristeroidobacter agariperforans TaxID=268404 RepID=UPI00101BC24F|nr:PepSY domain-containing protein [Peristeroidobacter agariperforans]